jgi:hypothetical protein
MLEMRETKQNKNITYEYEHGRDFRGFMGIRVMSGCHLDIADMGARVKR